MSDIDLDAIRARKRATVRHTFSDDDLCNYSCSCGGWRYAHVGVGEPTEVALQRHAVHLAEQTGGDR